MSRDASIVLAFGDGDHTFKIGWGQLAKIQEACDAGPFVILDRLASGRWKIEDIREPLRWGLIGGGLAPSEALKLIRDYVEDRPPHENLGIARQVMMAGVLGAPDEDRTPKKDQAPDQETDSTASQMGSSGSEPSTGLEPA